MSLSGHGVRGYDLWHHGPAQGKIQTLSCNYIYLLQVKLYLRHTAAGQIVEFTNTPFSVGEKRDLHCQLGEHYFGKTYPAETPPPSCSTQCSSTTQQCPTGETPQCSSASQQCAETPQWSSKSKRNIPKLRLQGTRKVGCPAGIQIREYILYPDYKVTVDAQNKWQVRKGKENMLENLNKDLLAGKEVKTVKCYYVCLPSEEAHHKTHTTGGMHALAQRIHPKVQMNIQEIVGAGITEVSEVKRALRLYVSKELWTKCNFSSTPLFLPLTHIHAH